MLKTSQTLMSRTTEPAALVCVLVALGGCGSTTPAIPAEPPSGTSEGGELSEVAELDVVASDEGALPTEGAPAPAQAPEEEPEAETPAPDLVATPERGESINLLATNSAEVVFSSARDHTRARVFDGRSSQHWQALPGDTAPWIEVRLPEQAHVDRIELIAGAPGGRMPTWGRHPRVKRVRVTHNGEAAGEFELDISERGLQPIAVAGGGGTWRVEVIETLEGREWQNVVMAELQVIGTAPDAGEGRPESWTDPAFVPPGTVRFDPDRGRVALLREHERAEDGQSSLPRSDADQHEEARLLALVRSVAGQQYRHHRVLRAIKQQTSEGSALWVFVGNEADPHAGDYIEGDEPYTRLYRISIPRGELPRLTAQRAIGGNIHDLRIGDFDRDQRSEIKLEMDNFEMQCGTGLAGEAMVLILDVDSLRVQVASPVGASTGQSEFSSGWTGRADLDDVNGDGHGDVTIRRELVYRGPHLARQNERPPEMPPRQSVYHYNADRDLYILQGDDPPPRPILRRGGCDG